MLFVSFRSIFSHVPYSIKVVMEGTRVYAVRCCFYAIAISHEIFLLGGMNHVVQ